MNTLPTLRSTLLLSSLLAAAHAQAGGLVSCPSASFSPAPMSAGAGSPVQNVSTGGSPMYALVGRFNDDVYPDIATANLSGNNVSILLGNGTGTFTDAPGSPVAMAASPSTNGSRPTSLASGHFNEDAHLDLAVGNRNSGTLTILLGSASGSFTTHANYTGIASVYAIGSGDFDGDGKADIATLDNNSSAVRLFRGLGGGNFAAFAGSPMSVTGVSNLRGIAIGQMVGNANVDIAVTGAGSDNIGVLRGNGDGTFVLQSTHAVVSDASASPVDVVRADLNADGFADLVVTTLASRGSGGDPPSPHSRAAVLLGSASGYAAVTHHWLGADLSGIAVADVNRDLIPDLIGSNAAWSFSGSVALGNGTGGFAAPTGYTAGGNPFHVVQGDFNIDGAADFAVVNQPSSTLSVYLNGCSGNAPPITSNDGGAGFSTSEDSALSLPNLLGNDIDPNGDPLLIEDFEYHGAGELVVNADGSASFDPAGDYEALDAGELATEQFTYVVGDGNGGTATGTVTLVIQGITDPRDLAVHYGSPQLPGIVLVGDVVVVNIDIENIANQDVSGGTLNISIPTGMTVGDTGFCTSQTDHVQCNFGQLAAGASIHGSFSLTLTAAAIGLRQIAFSLTGNEPDVVLANNSGSLSADVRPVAVFGDQFED